MTAHLLTAPDLFGVAFADTIKRSATISRCGSFRWKLTRTWSSDGGRVCFIGLNPSTADHRDDDPTVRWWTHWSRVHGYGGFTAVNLYPFRSPSPAECRKWSDYLSNGPDWCARDRLWENETVVVREAKAAALVVACWGGGTWDPEYVDHIVEQVETGEAPWPTIHCFGRTQDGSPTHPMARGRHRIPREVAPVVWRANPSSTLAAGRVA